MTDGASGPQPSELGLTQKDLGLTEQTASKLPNSGRAAVKVDGFLARVGYTGPLSRETAESEIDSKINRLDSLISKDPFTIVSANLEGLFGKVIVDQDGSLDIPSTFKPESQVRLAADYAGTEAVVSRLYTSTPDVQALPPDSFRIEFKGIKQNIDQMGLVLTNPGVEQTGVNTRFYNIPGQQINKERRPIPPFQQRILVIQDVSRSDGKIERYYAVSSAEALSDIVEDFKEAQAKPAVTQPQAEVRRNAQSSREPLDESTTVRAFNHIGYLADSVTNGTTSPGVLQNQLKYLESRGVAREKLEEVLRTHGITPTNEQEQNQTRERMQPIIDKLRVDSDKLTRLGEEVKLTPDEITQIQDYLNSVLPRLNTDPQVQWLQQTSQQLRSKYKSFELAQMFNRDIQEDPNITQPFVDTSADPVLKVPPDIYRKLDALRSLAAAKVSVIDYATKPHKSGNLGYGMLAKDLANWLEKGLNY